MAAVYPLNMLPLTQAAHLAWGPRGAIATRIVVTLAAALCVRARGASSPTDSV